AEVGAPAVVRLGALALRVRPVEPVDTLANGHASTTSAASPLVSPSNPAVSYPAASSSGMRSRTTEGGSAYPYLASGSSGGITRIKWSSYPPGDTILAYFPLGSSWYAAARRRASSLRHRTASVSASSTIARYA